MVDVILIRIKPNLPRDQHYFRGYLIRRSKGWHELPASLAEDARNEPLSDLNPSSVLLFDVKTPGEAAEVAAAENFRADPTGTPERPTRPVSVEEEPKLQAPPKRAHRVASER